LGVVAVLAGTTARIKSGQKETEQAPDRETQARLKLTEAPARELRNQDFQRVGLAPRALPDKNIGSAQELLHACPEKRRGWECHFLKRQPYDPPLVVPLGKDLVWQLACSADGRYLATTGFDSSMQGEVKLRDAATGKELHTLAGHAVAFQPAGGQLA